MRQSCKFFLSVSLLVHPLLGVKAMGETNAAPQGAKPARPLPPLPPVPTSPFNFFRELLATGPSERERLLASKSPEQRLALQNKLREYESLSPEERELRLRALDLRWYLNFVMRMAPSNRVEFLKNVPEADRPLVEERLRHWDQWSPDLQKELLTNDMAIRILVGTQTGLARPPSPPNLSLTQREQMENNIRKWMALPEDKRQQIYGRFPQLVELDQKEKTSALTPLSELERVQMEKTLESFARLPKAQRELCISGFKKFAALSPQERMQFLTNAKLWEAMNAKDRQTWRNLVNRMKLPPLPPRFNSPPMPPLPPRASSLAATNKQRVAGDSFFPPP